LIAGSTSSSTKRRGDEVIPLFVGELLADLEVVGGERLAEVGVGQGLGDHRVSLVQEAWT
jgi:hypothetical protein